ncbi:MAG: hypothetical protein Q9186_006039 [Xanthomendoza sp. 1 TL-2023]
MQSLPQELVTHIASFVDPNTDQSPIALLRRIGRPSKLPPLATLSRKWQHAVESHTFRLLRTKSTDLPYLTQVLTPPRRKYLSHLAYDIVLPTYTDNECAKYETKDDMERNSQAFTYAIHSLFQFLKSWEAGGVGTKPRSFFLDISDIYSPMDRFFRDDYLEDEEQFESGKRYDLWEHRYEHSFLQLSEHPTLPALSCISSFRLFTSRTNYRKVEPHSAMRLAAKLANLGSVDLTLNDNEKRNPHIRQQHRHDFATSLSRLSGPQLRDFGLSFYHRAPSNQYFSPPSALLPSAPSIDHLSRALHTVSQSPGLTTLKLQPIVLSPDLYWPQNPSATPTWPNLRQFHVLFDMVTPDGDWYFTRDPTKPIEDETVNDTDDIDNTDNTDDTDDPNGVDNDEDETNTDSDTASSETFHPDKFNKKREARAVGDYPIRKFRTIPSDAHINPLLLAMARAASQMRKLQSISLKCSVRSSSGPRFIIVFYAAGQKCKFDSGPEETDRARLYWFVGSWRPAEEVLKIWREGKEGLLVKFIQR